VSGAGLDAALAAIAAGRIVVISGDQLRGGDIDLMIAARHVTPEAINFMATHGRGLICLAVTPERAAQLGLSLINPGTARQTGRPFARSIEAGHGVSTGISAADRAHTIAVTIADNATSADLHSPGHVFPLIAHPGGISARRSTLEAGIALCREFDLGEGIVLCAILRADGTMARVEDMEEFARVHSTPILDITAVPGD